jgi:hypothetical protein
MLLVSAGKTRSLRIGRDNFSKELKQYVGRRIPVLAKAANFLCMLMLLLLILAWSFRNGILYRFIIKTMESLKINKGIPEQNEVHKSLTYQELKKCFFGDDEVTHKIQTMEKNGYSLDALKRFRDNMRNYYRILSYVLYFAWFGVITTFFGSPVVYFYKKYAEQLALLEIKQFIWDLVIKLNEHLRQKYIEILRNINQSFFGNLGKLFKKKYSESDLSQLFLVLFLFNFAVIFLSVLIDHFYDLCLVEESDFDVVKRSMLLSIVDAKGGKKNILVEYSWVAQVLITIVGCILFIFVKNRANKKSLGLFRSIIQKTKEVARRIIGIISSGNREDHIIRSTIMKNNHSWEIMGHNLEKIRSQVTSIIVVLIFIMGLSILCLTIALWKLRLFASVASTAIGVPKVLFDIFNKYKIRPDYIDDLEKAISLGASIINIVKKVIIAIFILLSCFMVFMVVGILANLSQKSDENDNLSNIEAYNDALLKITQKSNTLPPRKAKPVETTDQHGLRFVDFGIGFPLNITKTRKDNLFNCDIVTLPGIYVVEAPSGSGKSTFISSIFNNFGSYGGIILNMGLRSTEVDFSPPRFMTNNTFCVPSLDIQRLMKSFGVPHHFRPQGPNLLNNLCIPQQIKIPHEKSLTEKFIIDEGELDEELLKSIMDDLGISYLLGQNITARSLTPNEQFLILVAKAIFYFAKNSGRGGIAFFDEMLTGAHHREVISIIQRYLIPDMVNFVENGGMILIIDHTGYFKKALKLSACRRLTKTIQIDNKKQSLRIRDI